MSKHSKKEEFWPFTLEKEERPSRVRSDYPQATTQIFYTHRAFEDVLGLAEQNHPNEVSAYPVGYLLSTVEKSPYRTLKYEELTGLVVTHWILPPYQQNSFGHTGVENSARESSGDLSSNLLSSLRERRGWELGVVGKFHTHPFLGGRFLSGGDISSNWVGENAQRWKLENGLGVIPMLVGWISTHEGAKRVWRVSCFVNPTPSGADIYACPAPRLINLESKRIPPRGYWSEETRQELLSRLLRQQPEFEVEDVGRGWIRIESPAYPLFLLVNGKSPEGEEKVFFAEVHKRMEDKSTKFLWNRSVRLAELQSDDIGPLLGVE